MGDVERRRRQRNSSALQDRPVRPYWYVKRSGPGAARQCFRADAAQAPVLTIVKHSVFEKRNCRADYRRTGTPWSARYVLAWRMVYSW